MPGAVVHRLLTSLAVLSAVLAVGCGDTTTVVKTVTTEAPKTTTTAAAEPVSEPAATEAQLGDLLTLEGDESTLKMRVTKVLDPLPVGEYDEPEGGNRLVGIEIAIKNMGPQAYADALGNGSTIIVRGDQQSSSTIVSGGPCAGNFGSDVKIAAGDKRVGCIPFEVPAGKRLRSFQFTPNSGFADVTAEWDLRRAPSSTTAAEVDAPASSSPEPEERADSGAGGWTACDANISARRPTTSCGFASNVFYEYWVSGQESSITAYSPATGATYELSCSSDGSDVECSAEDGGAARFSQAAVDAYSQGQADAYARSHDIG